MEQKRRDFLKKAGMTGIAIISMGAAGILSGGAMAAEVKQGAAKAGGIADAMAAAGYAGAIRRRDIEIKLPEIAENGAVVPVDITSNIPGTTSLAIFVDKNPNPLAASYGFMEGIDAMVTTRVKMSETTMVRVAVKAGGKTYVASKEVKVTLGGCGG